MALVKPCARCKKLIPYGVPYCPTCKPIIEAERQAAKDHKAELLRKKYNKTYNRKRAQDDPKYRTFRNSKAWKQTSKAKLQACSWECEAHVSPNCTGLACEVHHVKPIRTPEGWELRLAWENLMGVCVQCHNILDNKTFKGKNTDGVIDLRAVEGRAPGGGSNFGESREDNGHRRGSLCQNIPKNSEEVGKNANWFD